MSASLYASVGRTARQLINKFGKRMIYRQKKDGQVYNDQTMRYEPSIKDTPFKGIRKNAKIEENPELPIQLGDCIILAAASGLPVPAVPDQIIMDGETWSVVRTRGPGGYGTGPQHPDPQGVAVHIAAIESRRQAIKRRMAALDRLSTSDARALDKAMTEMCALYAEYARSTVALVAFEAYRTPSLQRRAFNRGG